MSTSLAEQLQRLAVPQTSQLKRDKKRASLLFDPREAAGLKRETVFQIGLDGLEELRKKDLCFEKFKNSLFHITSKTFERSVQSAEDNKKLDKTIQQFLLSLSPYFLLNAAHKALEWLINRYSIHEYNRENLLMLIMPYHESNIFVRVVQVMKFKDHSDNWVFLKSLQKTGVHLPKLNLLNKAASDVYFLKFTAKFISLLLKVIEKPHLLTVQFNFYCTVFVGAVEHSQEVSEAQVTQMLPTLLKGLISDIPDYCAASYVIAAGLVAKTALNDRILDKLVDKISQVNVGGLKNEAILVLLVIYQSQKSYEGVPETACRQLAEKKWLPKTLVELNDDGCHIWPFLEQLVKANIEAGLKLDEEICRKFIEDLLSAIKLDEACIAPFMRIFFDVVRRKKKYPEHLRQWQSRVVETLERQYPEQFDKEVYRIMSSTEEGAMAGRKKCLQRLMEQAMSLKGKFDVFDKLYHPNAELRSQAIKHLGKHFKALRESEKEMIKSSFVDRLEDESVSVIRETLALIRKTKILDKVALKRVLIRLARRCQKDMNSLGAVVADAIEMLCENCPGTDWEAFIAIFPFLLPGSEAELDVAKRITISSFAAQNPVLKRLNEGKAFRSCQDFCKLIFEGCLTVSHSEGALQEFVNVLKGVPDEERDGLHKYVAMLILSCILPNECQIDIALLAVEIFISYFESSELTSAKCGTNIQDQLRVAREGALPLEAFQLCLKNVIMKTGRPNVNLGTADFYSDAGALSRYFKLLAHLLFDGKAAGSHRKYGKIFLDHFCVGVKNQVELLANLAICANAHCSSDNCLSNVVNIISSLLSSSGDGSANVVSRTSVFVPQILTMLANPDEKIRKKIVGIVEMLSKLPAADSSYSLLLQGILEHKEEVCLDGDQMPLIMFNILASPVDTNTHEDLAAILKSLETVACDRENPVYLKAGVMKMLSLVNSEDLFREMCSVGVQVSNDASESYDAMTSELLKTIIARYDASTANLIDLADNTWRLLESCLRDDKTILRPNVGIGHQRVPAVAMLVQVDKDFFENLKRDVQSKVLDLIIELVTVTQNHEILPAVVAIFKHINLDAKLIVEHIVRMRDVQSPKLDLNKVKRRRISVVPTVDILDTLMWRQGLSVLELIQEKKKIVNLEVLVPVLFDILKKCLEFDEQAAVEYPKQLILTFILHCCDRLDNDNFPKTAFNVVLIVKCISASQNPQTHHHALVVLTRAATLIPDQVLQHVITIFTFMGSAVLRHDDAYSFQIIERVVDAIIPILVEGGKIEDVAKVLRVFVDALLDIPEHRRLRLYKQLLDKVGPERYLHVFLLLVFEAHVLNHLQRDKDSSKEEKTKRLDIAAAFCGEFEPPVIVGACIDLIQYLKELPEEKPNNLKLEGFSIIFSTPKQFRHFKYTLVTFVSSVLSTKEFLTKMVNLSDEVALSMEAQHKELILNILTYIQRITKVAERNSNTPQEKYWKVLLHHSHEVLDSVNAILTPQMFTLVVRGLMVHNLTTIRKRCLEILNAKLQCIPEFFDECKEEDLNSLLPIILNIIKGVSKRQLEHEEEVLIQTALLSLKLLVGLLAPKKPEDHVEVLNFITGSIKCAKAHSNVLASMVLCLAELVTQLGPYAIPGLSSYMPALLKLLKHQKRMENSLLLFSVITAFEKILNRLALFLSPYMERMLFELAILGSKWEGIAMDTDNQQPTLSKLESIRQKIAANVPPRILIPALEQCYNNLVAKGHFGGIKSLMNILADSMGHMKAVDVGKLNVNELTQFFLNMLQFRAENKAASREEINEVEAEVVKALTTFVLKLSEGRFRTLYYKLFDWAMQKGTRSERVITFYSLSSGIAECLKGLFVLFAGHFLNNSAEVLDACNANKSEELYFDDDSDNALLLESVLRTLLAVTTYDNHKFVDKDRFTTLMQPIVDQLDNTLGGIEDLKRRNEKLLTPCIVQFAVATADDSLWKVMNYQILLKMRNSSSDIRLVALHCLTEVVKKLGEDFLPLLPETIPFLAELLEDEEEAVEKACKAAVQQMEKVLGEPLQKYF